LRSESLLREAGREVVRMALSDGDFALDLSVTDLRLYSSDGSRPDIARVRDVASRLARGVPALVSVGLTRPFSSRPDEPSVHWLQVNNIHLEDNPAWRLTAHDAARTEASMARVELDALPF
jgi:hypothetical protein